VEMAMFYFILHSCTCQNFIFVYWCEYYCEQCHMFRYVCNFVLLPRKRPC